MIKILNKYCNQENGLLLFNPPTGSGKTFYVLNWIYSNYKKYCKEGRKIFFVTNLKKNLPYLELKELFEKDNKLADFEKDVIYINSNIEFVLENFEKVESEINDFFKDKTFWTLRQRINTVNYYKDKPNLNSIVKAIEDEIRNKYERLFREKITKYLKENFPNKKERLFAIKHDKKLQWIEKLYPPVFTSKAKIFFLSIDKFFTKNTTLVEPSYYFANNEITKDAIVFIDEFDATKERILNKIIEQGQNQKNDYIDLFNKINWALSNNELPKQFLTDSKEREKQIKQNSYFKSVGNIEKLLKERASAIVEEYNVQYSFKSKGQKRNERNLLFHDFQYHSIYRNGKYIKLTTDKTDKLNYIDFVKDAPNTNELNIVSLLNQIKGFLKTFQSIVKDLATNYSELVNEKRKAISPNETEYTYDLALSSVLEEFRLETKYKNFIIDSILSERERKTNRDKLNFDLSIYENGFRYYDFVDDEQHETITKTFIYNFQNTPEKFLLKLAEKSKVIGISATATVETVTGNYDIDYLRRQLGNSFFELTGEEKNRLKSIFKDQNLFYDKVKIHTEWIGSSDIRQSFNVLFENKELAKEILNKLPENIDLPLKKQYNNIRIYRISKTFKNFLEQTDIHAFLCLLTKEPKSGDNSLDLELLNEIFTILIEDVTETTKLFRKEDEIYNAYTIINSNDFDTNKDKFQQVLENGNKLFIISMYQTLGAGQNLQFKAPNPEKLVNVRNPKLYNWNKENKTDFNAIYLDKPTHLIQLINNSLNEEGFIKYLFQLEFLLEAGRISIAQIKKEVERAFEYLLASNKTKVNKTQIDLYNDKNIKQHFSKFIIQALGRICRTNLKSKNIYIYAHDEIEKFIADFDIENNLVLNEFASLVKYCNINTKPENIESVLINKAHSTNKKISSLIKKYVKRKTEWKWKIKEIEEWKNLRLLCLTFPTLSMSEAKKFSRFIDLYIEMPIENNKIDYKQEGDFETVKIGFNGKYNFSVSEESARLNELMQIPDVKGHFEMQKWATEFETGKYILPPQLFNNIYKGALGEEVGKIIFEKHLDITLEELENDIYELFDYRIKGTNVYVDFKHWQDQTKIRENRNEILNKLKKAGGDMVLIINIISEQYFKPNNSIDKKIFQIPSMWDYEKKLFVDESIKLITNIANGSYK